VLVDLRDASWLASGPALSAIVSNYEIVADLSTFYGHLDELRWRLRYRLELSTPDERNYFDGLIEELIGEMKSEVADLLPRVEAETESPHVLAPLLGAIPVAAALALPLAGPLVSAVSRIVSDARSRRTETTQEPSASPDSSPTAAGRPPEDTTSLSVPPHD
jgi:hypothetical protein